MQYKCKIRQLSIILKLAAWIFLLCKRKKLSCEIVMSTVIY